MKGEIAVGSYGPLPTVAKVSTTPIPPRLGRGGVVKGTRGDADEEEEEEEGIFFLDARKLAEKTTERHQLKEEQTTEKYDSGEGVMREGGKKTATSLPWEEPLMEMEREVGGVSDHETQQVPRRENSKLRALLRAIELYDRYVCVCVCV